MIEIMSMDLMSQHEELARRDLTLSPGQFLFHLGDKVSFMHFVEEGVVHLVRHQIDGSTLVLQRAGPGSILAEASLYSDVYHCDAVARFSAVILAVSRDAIHTKLSTNQSFSKAWARHLALEVQRTRLHVEILSLKTVAARLDAWISWNGGTRVEKGNWKAIASEIGVSPEALYREMANRRSSQP